MRGLQWSEHSYRRLYDVDTVSWHRLGMAGQAVWLSYQRKCDLAGVLLLHGEQPADALLFHFRWSPDDAEMLATGLDRCLEEGYLVHSLEHDCLLDPEFVDRDQTATSDRARKRKSRASRRTQIVEDVTKRDDSDTDCDEPARVTDEDDRVTECDMSGTGRDENVTGGHSTSQTQPHPQKNLSNERATPSDSDSESDLDSEEESASKPPGPFQRIAAVLGEIGVPFAPPDIRAVLGVVKTWERAGGTFDQLLDVIRSGHEILPTRNDWRTYLIKTLRNRAARGELVVKKSRAKAPDRGHSADTAAELEAMA